jgi:glucosamine 6-phosphate synthetase-like amidotransferase/phosphosugar isomerase protein
MVESILASAIPLQLIAERLARARGRNPDLIGRDDPRQAAAADA